MAGNVADLSENQAKALSALLASPSVEAASQRCGLSARTVFRFQQDPAFQAAYAEARRNSISQATARLQAAAAGAVDALEEIAGDPSISPSARVSACRSVLEYAYRGAELEELEGRLSALEGALEEGDD